MTKKRANTLKSLGVSLAQITLDGGSESHNFSRPAKNGRDSYVKILRGCKNIVESGMQLVVRVNLNKLNISSIQSLIDDLKANGINAKNSSIHISRMVDHGNCGNSLSKFLLTTKSYAKEWVKVLETLITNGYSIPSLMPMNYNCAFDLPTTAVVGVDGHLHHCSSSSTVMATIDESGNDKDLVSSVSQIKNRIPISDNNCIKCEHLPQCMGGCSYFELAGMFKCNPEKFVMPELVRLFARQKSRNLSLAKGGEKNE